jgi:hypothetical protein
MSKKRFVERIKTGPISFEKMYEKLKKMGDVTTRGDEAWKLWGYSEDVEDTTVRQRNSDFSAWLDLTYGLRWESTNNRRLYPSEVVEGLRRKRKKLISSST